MMCLRSHGDLERSRAGIYLGYSAVLANFGMTLRIFSICFDITDKFVASICVPDLMYNV
jgi:hypothetical protein